MQKDACCNGNGLCKWFCPSLTSLVAGLIMIAAGGTKLLAGKGVLTAVGGMALSVFGVAPGEMASLALYLGGIAAVIEVVGGLSFALGCRMTSRWAAFFLSAVIGIALLFKLTHLKPLEGDLFSKAAGLLEQIRLDLLLFAVFSHKAFRLIQSCCGMGCSAGSSCCSTETSKK